MLDELAQSPAQRGWPSHGRIMSLWDMYEIKAFDLLRAVRKVAAFHVLISEFERREEEEAVASLVAERTTAPFRKDIESLIQSCSKLGANVTSRHAQKLLGKLEAEISWRELSEFSKKIDETLRYEIENQLFFVLDNLSHKYFFDPLSLFDPGVFDKYPTASSEVEEAGKCFAFERYTACNIHLMRALEAPLSEVCDDLKIPKHKRQWHVALQKIDSELGKSHETREIKGKVSYFSEVAKCLRPIIGDRNDAAHISPLASPEDSRRHFNCVIYLMNHLAKHQTEAET